MAHSRGRGPVRGPGPKRLMIWSEGPRTSSPAIQSIIASGKTLWNLGQTSGGGVTVVRIRGAFRAWLEVVGSINDAFGDVAIGIGIVSGDAFSVGQSAMPGPLSDPQWDWMYVQYFGAVVGSTVTEEFKGLAAIETVIDSKSMRKVQPNETIFGVVETEGEVGVVTLSFSAMTRMLSKLG